MNKLNIPERHNEVITECFELYDDMHQGGLRIEDTTGRTYENAKLMDIDGTRGYLGDLRLVVIGDPINSAFKHTFSDIVLNDEQLVGGLIFNEAEQIAISSDVKDENLYLNGLRYAWRSRLADYAIEQAKKARASQSLLRIGNIVYSGDVADRAVNAVDYLLELEKAGKVFEESSERLLKRAKV